MRFDVLGLPVHALDLERAAEEVAGWVETRRRGYVCVTGVHGVMESQRSDRVRLAHLEADLVVPDGMPLVWCGRRLGVDVGRVYGPDLMLRLLERGLPLGWRHAFYGSSEEVLGELTRRLGARFPGLQVAGTLSPPFRELRDDEGRAHVEALDAMQPDVIWVGLSTPNQERWMHRWRPALAAPALLGVGAAFDFHAGRVRQAPPWVAAHGMEWAYRLWREPRRLWRRYLRNNPAFVARLALRPPRLTP